jgi:hypothetical protein
MDGSDVMPPYRRAGPRAYHPGQRLGGRDLPKNRGRTHAQPSFRRSRYAVASLLVAGALVTGVACVEKKKETPPQAQTA